MANTCYAQIVFSGQQYDLDKIYDTIVHLEKDARFDSGYAEKLSFDIIEPHVPQYYKEDIFKQLGYNYDEQILNSLFSQEDHDILLEWENAALEKLKKAGFLGFRETYVNNLIYSFSAQKLDNILFFDIECAWNIPIDFFFYVSKQYGCEITICEKVQSHFTHIYYNDKSTSHELTTYHQLENSLEQLLHNPTFREKSYLCKLFEPSDFVLACLYTEDYLSAIQTITNNSLKKENILFCAAKNKKRLLCNFYKDSIFGNCEDSELAREKIDHIVDNLEEFF